MHKIHSDVLAFHKKFFPDRVGEKPQAPDDDMLEFRIKLMTEEFNELITAIRAGDLVKIADGIADTIYTVVGTGITYGIPVSAVWDEVHRSNMTKEIGTDGNYTVGKACKGRQYSPPNIEKVFNKNKIKECALKIVDVLNYKIKEYYNNKNYIRNVSRVKYSDEQAGWFYVNILDNKSSESLTIGCALDEELTLYEGRNIAEHVQFLGYMIGFEYQEGV